VVGTGWSGRLLEACIVKCIGVRRILHLVRDVHKQRVALVSVRASAKGMQQAREREREHDNGNEHVVGIHM